MKSIRAILAASPWPACEMQLYLGDVESLQRSSLQLKAAGKMAVRWFDSILAQCENWVVKMHMPHHTYHDADMSGTDCQELQLEHAAVQWRGHFATRKLIPGQSNDPTTKTKELAATSHLHRLRDRLRPFKVAPTPRSVE